MPWLGITIALAAVAAIFAVLARAMRKTQHNESWGVGEMAQRYVQPLPYNPGGLPPIEIVSEPDEDERGAESEGGASRSETE